METFTLTDERFSMFPNDSLRIVRVKLLGESDNMSQYMKQKSSRRQH